jgi:hypothetical protein
VIVLGGCGSEGEAPSAQTPAESEVDLKSDDHRDVLAAELSELHDVDSVMT